MTEKDAKATKPQSDKIVTADTPPGPDPERCDPAGSFIPSTGTLQRPVSLLGTFGAGLKTKVEFGRLDDEKVFKGDDKVTAGNPTRVTATEIDIVVAVKSEASGGGRYVKVTQGDSPNEKTGVSSKEIFTLVQVEE